MMIIWKIENEERNCNPMMKWQVLAASYAIQWRNFPNCKIYPRLID